MTANGVSVYPLYNTYDALWINNSMGKFMIKRASINFIESATPINNFVTKFGGQPNWVKEPTWPLSKKTGQPMRFIGQIVIDPEIFGKSDGQMAYLFMSDNSETTIPYYTWAPEEGESAVIIQPGKCELPTAKIATGPSLQKNDTSSSQQNKSVAVDCEYGVALHYGEDPLITTREKWDLLDATSQRNALDTICGTKIGGYPRFFPTPAFWKDSDFFLLSSWKLLLQLDSLDLPFNINFGHLGVAYVLLSADNSIARFVWMTDAKHWYFELILKGYRNPIISELIAIHNAIDLFQELSGNELKQKLCAHLPWRCLSPNSTERESCIELLNALESRGVIDCSADRQKKDQLNSGISPDHMRPLCASCKQELIPYFPDIKVCPTCVAYRILYSVLSNCNQRVSGIVSCDQIFNGAEAHVLPILMNNLSIDVSIDLHRMTTDDYIKQQNIYFHF